jgi:hypothetical protein
MRNNPTFSILYSNKIFIFLFLILLFTSCKDVGLLSEKNSWVLDNIETIGDFFTVYLILQVSIIIVGVLLSFLLGKLGFVISLIAHFIWIVLARDYGYLNLILLFGLFSIISTVLNVAISLLRHRNN